MCRKSALHTLQRNAPDGGFSPTSLAETTGSGTGLRESGGVLQHTPEKHFGLLEGAQIRAFSQAEFRQSLLRRTSGKRITAYDGSRFLSQQKSLSQGKPILTGREKTVACYAEQLRRLDFQKAHIASWNMVLNMTTNLVRTEDEFSAPANPLLAAAVATSLYGSAAPYTQVREKAQEEVDDLIGISQPPLDVSTAYRQEKLGHFTSVVGFAGPIHKDRSSKQKFESIPLAGLSTQRHRNHSSALPTPLPPDVPSSATTTDGDTQSAGQSSARDRKDSDSKTLEHPSSEFADIPVCWNRWLWTTESSVEAKKGQDYRWAVTLP
ncbi:unnamed protein product [Schistocephalus solidus]|uniref:Uncharacterized protein n=1 Tax=Schistocephalus solidus TaxID=70667 RepID=A0A183SUE1_SCHSO|nr:unnamed protein product [Schistocephalus solidus]